MSYVVRSTDLYSWRKPLRARSLIINEVQFMCYGELNMNIYIGD